MFKIKNILLIMILLGVSFVLVGCNKNSEEILKEDVDNATNVEVDDNNTNVEDEKLNNFNLKFVKTKNSKVNKKLVTVFNDRNVYYYNEGIELYLCENEECYTIKEALEQNMVEYSAIVEKANSKSMAYDGGSKIYSFDDFNIVDCNVIKGINEVIFNDIIIGDKSLDDLESCRI